MALNQNYYELWFESFELEKVSGHKSPKQLRLLKSQTIPSEIEIECSNKNISPFILLTECSKSLLLNYPIGTKFKIKAKLTDKENEGLFLYSYFGWKPLEIIPPAP